jgi:CheY-like chemotaxis protein
MLANISSKATTLDFSLLRTTPYRDCHPTEPKGVGSLYPFYHSAPTPFDYKTPSSARASLVGKVFVCRVLIVDDSPALRRALRLHLERHPELEVCGEAENGRAAIEKVGQLKPDFVILDFSMPVMDGLEAARHIATLAPRVPMLMFTSFTSDHVLDEAHKAGIARVVSKNKIEELAAVIESLIEGSMPSSQN